MLQAALRRAIGELIFFAGVNDLERCQRIVSAWGIKLDDSRCADYDKRTPLCVYPSLELFAACQCRRQALEGVAIVSHTI